MYYCYQCGHRFVTPDYVDAGEWHGDYYEPGTRRLCPSCGSDEIEEATEWDE